MKTPTKVIVAQVLGQKAFVNGAKRVPAHDPELMTLLAGNEVGQGIPVLDAWLRGWDEANLAADVQ